MPKSDVSVRSQLGSMKFEWQARSKTRLTFMLLAIAVALAIAAIPAAYILTFIFGQNGMSIVPLLWFWILIVYAPQIFRRLYWRENHITIFQKGLILDGVTILFGDIERVHHYRHLHHINKRRDALYQWNLELKSTEIKKITSLNDAVGANVDPEKFNKILRDSGCQICSFHDKRIVKDQRKRFSKKNQRTHYGKSNLIDDIEINDMEWSDIYSFLKKGERKRNLHIFISSLHTITSTYLYKVSQIFMHILFVLALIPFLNTVIYFILIAFDANSEHKLLSQYLLKTNNIYYQIFFDAAVAITFLYIGAFLYEKSGSIELNANKNRAISDQLSSEISKMNIDVLKNIIEKNDKYALYLRGFEKEGLVYVEERPDISAPIVVSAIPRDFDTNLISKISSKMICFGLANIKDPTPPSCLVQLFTQSKNWEAVADKLIQHASKIFLNLNSNSQGLLREVSVLDKLGLHDRALIILPAPESKREKQKVQRCLKSFRHVIFDDELGSTSAVDTFLKS